MTTIEYAQSLLQNAPKEIILVSDDIFQLLSLTLGNSQADTVVFSGRHYAELFRYANYDVQTGIEAEPSTETVEKMANLLREKNPQNVVAVGGGSVIDAAKAAYLLYQTNCKLNDLFGVNRWSNANFGKKLKRIVAIPTTSGTGSEATPYSNIVDHSSGVKKLIAEEQIIPAIAFCPPLFQKSMSEDLTRATGCDALAHLIEGFLNVGADSKHPEANTWAKTGIALIKEFLPLALKNPDNETARRGMLIASTLGGMTIRFKSTGVPHLCSFSWFGRISHGEAVALLLPAAWEYYLANPQVASRTMELSEFFPGSSPKEVIASFRKFLDSIGLPSKLSKWQGITMELLEATARSGGENKMKLDNAPQPIPLEKSYDILLDIMKKSY
ncbi:MAG: iron-containing alcohol dehydrogenase [Lentisphaeria bacterium]|nr:iron-containing alcohol dehydrogenase [Lentisphaeria bacterium]